MPEINTDVMIIGAGGKVAAALIQIFLNETDWQIRLASSRVVRTDVPSAGRIQSEVVAATDYAAIKELCLRTRPRIIVNAVAMTNVDACETEKQLAHDLNVKVVENLASICHIIDSHLIHYSTDYIFNGNKGPYLEQDVPDPLNYYGKTKLAGENAILIAKIPHTIIRTNIVYGLGIGVKTDFVTWVADKCRAEEVITIADDQYGNPTTSNDLAWATLKVIERSRTGIYNIAGGDYLNRYDFAMRIAKFFGLGTSTIQPVKTSELKLKARRPLKAGLITLKEETDLQIKPTTIETGLQEYKQQLPHPRRTSRSGS